MRSLLGNPWLFFRGSLLGVLLVVLLGPAVLLAPRDAVRDSSGRAGDGCGACNTSEKRHVSLLSPVGRVERGHDVILGDVARRDELCFTVAQCLNERRRPAVLEDQDGRR